MSAVAAHEHQATAASSSSSSSSINPTPEYITPPVPSESHPWYGGAHQQGLRSALTSEHEHINVHEHGNGNQINDMTLFTASMTGNLAVLRELLKTHDPNTTQPSTGLSALHYASSRGYIQLVNYLLDKAGASVDLEDREGETALLKAAYNGHTDIVEVLIEKHDADVSHQDKDGWSALHNACSSNQPSIASTLLDHYADINVISKMGHTPLINAAAKGSVPMVKFLLENDANPLLRNRFGETAYDAAAASAYPYVCELLEDAEKDWWTGRHRSTNGAIIDVSEITENIEYEPLKFHVTIPIMLYENQRAVSSFIGLTKPDFSASSLQKNESPWTSYPSNEPTHKQFVQLPPLSYNPGGLNQSAWFWLSDWHVDQSHPLVDAITGWQYSKSFDTPDEQWLRHQPASGTNWVRRRRWFRVMKKRVDVEGAMQPETVENDYLMTAESIFGTTNNENDAEDFSREWRIHIYNQAIRTLIDGVKDDQDVERRTKALQLMQTYIQNAELLGYTFEDVTEMAPNQGTSTSISPLNQAVSQQSTSSPATISPLIATSAVSNNALITPTMSSIAQTSQLEARYNLLENLERSYSPNNSQGRLHRRSRHNSQNTLTERLPSLSRASSYLSQSSAVSRPANVWEKDENATDCRRCGRYFSILLRRHHCRMCGLVVCDRCSMNRALLTPDQIVHDPSISAEQRGMVASMPQRLCDSCSVELHSPRSRPSISSIGIPPSLRRSMSAQSVMNECPVCGRRLSSVGSSKGDQERHVQDCLNAENPVVQRVKYVLYRLKDDSALIGQECTICFEDFIEGDTVARLNCLCSYHRHCIHDWFRRGKGCPVHSAD